MSAWSVATMTCDAPERAARSATRTTMGLPPRSASGLPGSRLDASRAGMMTVNDISRPQRRGVQVARFVRPHDGYAVTDRVGKLVGLADQFLRLPVIVQRAFANGADQDVYQSGIHVISPQCNRPGR